MTQKERILQYMKDFGSITQAQAFYDLGVFRLASRISELRREHYPIKAVKKIGKNRYGETVYFSEYSLTEEKSIDIKA